MLKVLGGPLCGTEVILGPESCFVRPLLHVGNTPVLETYGDLPDQQEPALGIPVHDVTPNVRILLGQPHVKDESFLCDVHDRFNGASIKAFTFNTPITIGGLSFSVKRQQATWSNAVLAFREATAASGSPSRPSKAALVLRVFTVLVVAVSSALGVYTWRSASANGALPERLAMLKSLPLVGLSVKRTPPPSNPIRNPRRDGSEMQGDRALLTASRLLSPLALRTRLIWRSDGLSITVVDPLSDTKLSALERAMSQLRTELPMTALHLTIDGNHRGMAGDGKSGPVGYQSIGAHHIAFR